MPELPTKFYDLEIPSRIGSKLGQILKIDTCTSATIRGRYARICIKVPLEKPLKTHLYIGHHKHALHYENLSLLCTHCEKFGHSVISCPEVIHLPKEQTQNNNQVKMNNPPNIIPSKVNEWKIVVFPKKNMQPPIQLNFGKGQPTAMAVT